MSRLPVLPPPDERQRYTLEEAVAYLRQSRSKLYCDIAAGRVTVIKDGRRTYIPGAEIIRRSTIPA